MQPRSPGSGRLVAFGDSECVDSLSAQQGSAPCWWLLQALLAFACDGKRDAVLFPDHLRLLQSLGDEETLPARAPTTSSAHGDTHSAAADDANPAACLLSRMGLTLPLPLHGLGRAEWSTLPDEPFGVLAHWPHAAAEPFLPDLSAADFAMVGGGVSDGLGGSSGGGFGVVHLVATRAASAGLVLCTFGAALLYVLTRTRAGRREKSRAHRQPSKSRQRSSGATPAVVSNRLHAV